jgi:hypothetical protein
VEPVLVGGVGAVDVDLRRVKVQLSYMPIQINLFVQRFRNILEELTKDKHSISYTLI